MPNPLFSIDSIEQSPDRFLSSIGEVFARFDQNTQDSGNISLGIKIENARYFIKSAGLPDDSRPYLPHAARVSLLHNAVSLSRSCDHVLLPPLQHMIQSPWGPLLVYNWVDGELVYAPSHRRDDPQTAFQRFLHLPVEEITDVLDQIYDLHNQLAHSGWIMVDFYDGCLIYDFEQCQMHLVDLDMYHRGPFINEMGRMFGSSRFMAPEESVLNARIDQRSNVFTLSRLGFFFLSDGTLSPNTFRGSRSLYAVLQKACAQAPEERFQSVADFYAAWSKALVNIDFFPG